MSEVSLFRSWFLDNAVSIEITQRLIDESSARGGNRIGRGNGSSQRTASVPLCSRQISHDPGRD
jgi:hypothetical protein